MSTSSNTELIDTLYTHFGKGEVPEVLGMMDPTIIWNEASCSTYADGNPYTSPDAVLNGVFGRIMADNEYFLLENIQLTTLGTDKVLATLNYSGKLKSDGEPYITHVVHEWTIGDGKVKAFQQYIGLGKQ